MHLEIKSASTPCVVRYYPVRMPVWTPFGYRYEMVWVRKW